MTNTQWNRQQGKVPRRGKWTTAVLAAVALGTAIAGCGKEPTQPTTRARIAADDTAKNVRDRNDATVTPLDQSNAAPDRELTQRIRQALVSDDALSVTAKNVKVITIAGGPVTLRGPVSTASEKTIVVAKARSIAGSRRVVDELEVAVN